MALRVILLDHDENFIKFLDPDLLVLEETREQYALNRIQMTYAIDDASEARRLFKVGHKIWVHDDNDIYVHEDNLEDCLYVIPESLKNDFFSENQVEFEAEEVLTELNYAPLFCSTELQSSTGFTFNNDGAVKVDRFFLEYWFGNYFNIGFIQDCLTEEVQFISPLGTMTLMELLRYIETETSHVFITRYRKDRNSNVIHRYLDFMNPKVDYSQFNIGFTYEVYDESEEVVDFPDEIQEETYDPEDEVIETITEGVEQVDVTNFELRILEKDSLEIIPFYDNDEELESLDNGQIGFDGESEIYDFDLDYEDGVLTVSNSGWVYDSTLASLQDAQTYYSQQSTLEHDYSIDLHEDFIIQLYNTQYNRVEWECDFNQLVKTSPDVLDLGYNAENITFEVDEAETYTAVAPLISDSGSDSLNKSQINSVINNWINLQVNKGDTIPMIVQKVTGSAYPSKTRNQPSDYWNYCIRPSDTNDEKEYESAIAYWNAPFTKHSGEVFVADDTITNVEYSNVRGRLDVKDPIDVHSTPKLCTVDTSATDKYAIYNDVAMKLKEKRTPNFNVEVDVKNFRKNKYNSYDPFTKVYVKIPTLDRLVTASVVKTVKNALDVGENKVELGNYSINTKTNPSPTMIDGENVKYTYPKKGKLQVELINLDDESIIPKNRLISFSLSKVENDTIKSTGKTWRRFTNNNGVASIGLAFGPGKYLMTVTSAEDAEFESSEASFFITVAGKITKKKKATKKNVSKKSKLVKVTKKLYWNKWGHSPGGKTIIAMGLAATSAEKQRYKGFWKTVFKKKCPVCGSTELYWGYRFGSTFRGRVEGGSNEGRVFCEKCGTAFTVFGNGGSKRLTVIEQPTKATSKEVNWLKQGRYLYEVYSEVVKPSNVTAKSGVTRGAISRSGFSCPNKSGTISKKVEKQALAIAKNYAGVACAKAIHKWIYNNIKNDDREGFYQSPEQTLNRKRGNDACRVDLFMHMCDAAGVMKSGVGCYYVHKDKKAKFSKNGKLTKNSKILNHVYAIVNGDNVDFNSNKGWGKIQGGFPNKKAQSKYPCLPFSRKY